MKLTFKTSKAMNDVLEGLGNLQRWTWFFTGNNFNEANKQALNCIATYMLAKHSELVGKTIIWERFPKVAIYRAFQKVFLYFDTPEYIMHEICELGGIETDIFDQETRKIIKEKTDEGFANFVCEGIGTYEFRIYRAATKLATYVELVENEHKLDGEFFFKVQEIVKSLEEFSDIPGVKAFSNPESAIFKVLRRISKLRNQNRWVTHVCTVGCSVLAHLFDTAVFAYMMSLEQNPEDEELATKMFFMGIFHDVAETWTKDIPSPVKDRISGFRKATEEYELKVIEENLYSGVPVYMAEALKDVMMEDADNLCYKKLLKGADYLAADSECWRQYRAGSKDKYLLEAVTKRRKNIESGKDFLTPICYQLHEYFEESARKEEFLDKLYEFFKEEGCGNALEGLKKLMS